MELGQFARILGESAVVISNRAHGLIVAAICGVPTICIETDDKLRSIQQMLPESSLLLPVSQIATGLVAAIDNAHSNKQVLKDTVKDEVANRKGEASAMIDYVFEY